jgi:hypothetical protein
VPGAWDRLESEIGGLVSELELLPASESQAS